MVTCIEKDCKSPAQLRKMCPKHYRHWSYTDEGREELKNNRSPSGGQPIDNFGYDSAHHRVKREFGWASNYTCVDCSGTAESWSLKHNAKIEIENRGVSAGRLFSRDMDDYAPRCNQCHREYDRLHDLKRSGTPENFVSTQRPETKERAKAMVDRIKAGTSARQVARDLGLHHTTVFRNFAVYEGMTIKEWKASQVK